MKKKTNTTYDTINPNVPLLLLWVFGEPQPEGIEGARYNKMQTRVIPSCAETEQIIGAT